LVVHEYSDALLLALLKAHRPERFNPTPRQADGTDIPQEPQPALPASPDEPGAGQPDRLEQDRFRLDHLTVPILL
jgi:hypothetical protein